MEFNSRKSINSWRRQAARSHQIQKNIRNVYGELHRRKISISLALSVNAESDFSWLCQKKHPARSLIVKPVFHLYKYFARIDVV